MRKTLLLLPLALLTLSACGGAKNEAAEANETISGDSNTMGEAVADVNAASAENAAFSEAEAAYSGNTAGLDTSIPDGNEVVE